MKNLADMVNYFVSLLTGLLLIAYVCGLKNLIDFEYFNTRAGYMITLLIIGSLLVLLNVIAAFVASQEKKEQERAIIETEKKALEAKRLEEERRAEELAGLPQFIEVKDESGLTQVALSAVHFILTRDIENQEDIINPETNLTIIHDPEHLEYKVNCSIQRQDNVTGRINTILNQLQQNYQRFFPGAPELQATCQVETIIDPVDHNKREFKEFNGPVYPNVTGEDNDDISGYNS